ncbi:hypothetical protein [Pseudomonas sp. PS02303]|uniref:hypothetical protein n=1 Tax=Pseudomonas sp. PS02303 TaxID=2991429 RepID=UPI00249C1854|nr:hypothetical protein [Pseudomonas sp. PS02303]
MKQKLQSRFVHLFALIIVIALAVTTRSIWPNLTEKPTDILAFVGFWVTLYGLSVAIFEIARIGSVSDSTLRAANNSYNGLKLQMELQEVKSCQEIINSSVSELRNKKAIPVIFLSRIKHVYLSVFPGEESTEDHKQNILRLNSYEYVTTPRKSKTQAPTQIINPQYPLEKLGAKEHPYQMTIDTLNRMHDDLSRYSALKNDYKRKVV